MRARTSRFKKAMKDLAEDSMFPCKDSDSVIVKVAFKLRQQTSSGEMERDWHLVASIRAKGTDLRHSQNIVIYSHCSHSKLKRETDFGNSKIPSELDKRRTQAEG